MGYGINFGLPAIPDGVAKKFAKQKKYGLPRGHYANLSGVAMNEEERDAMVIQATNGTRRIWVEPKHTAGGTWFGIYTY